MSRVICAECGSTAELVSGAKVYPRRKDLHGRRFWLCPCGAYCGCHPKTSKALGSPAGPRLRRLRARVHALLDPLWARKMVRDEVSKKKARGAAYGWLARELDIPIEESHVGMFNVDRCERAIAALERVYAGGASV